MPTRGSDSDDLARLQARMAPCGGCGMPATDERRNGRRCWSWSTRQGAGSQPRPDTGGVAVFPSLAPGAIEVEAMPVDRGPTGAALEPCGATIRPTGKSQSDACGRRTPHTPRQAIRTARVDRRVEEAPGRVRRTGPERTPQAPQPRSAPRRPRRTTVAVRGGRPIDESPGQRSRRRGRPTDLRKNYACSAARLACCSRSSRLRILPLGFFGRLSATTTYFGRL